MKKQKSSIYEVMLILHNGDKEDCDVEFVCQERIGKIVKTDNGWDYFYYTPPLFIPNYYQIEERYSITVRKGFEEKPTEEELEQIKFDMSEIMLSYIANKQAKIHAIYELQYETVLSYKNKLIKE